MIKHDKSGVMKPLPGRGIPPTVGQIETFSAVVKKWKWPSLANPKFDFNPKRQKNVKEIGMK